MFTIRDFPTVTTKRGPVYSAVDIERRVAVELVSSRGEIGGFVWVMNLNGAQIPFETVEYLNDDRFQGRIVPRFAHFGSLGFGPPELRGLRHEFADTAEKRAAQMLAVEGVLVQRSWSFRLQEFALITGRVPEEMAKIYPPFEPPLFNFEERIYALEDFGYKNGEVGSR